eukprot:GILK01006355.1.p1 GENE.GILK01006355.1~~GILK01006355.1.p1  ORF type:complete len:415 (-),score=48.30 GILK01006355.1:64-1308(-)
MGGRSSKEFDQSTGNELDDKPIYKAPTAPLLRATEFEFESAGSPTERKVQFRGDDTSINGHRESSAAYTQLPGYPDFNSRDGDHLQAPNYDEMIRRVSRLLLKHISKGEENKEKTSSRSYAFDEKHFLKDRWRLTYPSTIPICGPLTAYHIDKLEYRVKFPSLEDVYRFIKTIFVKAQLTAECSIIFLIYIERIMEMANIDLLVVNWRPISLAALLLASKVWEDISSWNVEFAYVCNQYSLPAINLMEMKFLRFLEYNLYIAGNLYAKYYFALKSLNNAIVPTKTAEATNELLRRTKSVLSPALNAVVMSGNAPSPISRKTSVESYRQNDVHAQVSRRARAMTDLDDESFRGRGDFSDESTDTEFVPARPRAGTADFRSKYYMAMAVGVTRPIEQRTSQAEQQIKEALKRLHSL